MSEVEQGYPGGPRPEGSHRAVFCMNCCRPEARRTLIRRINDRLLEDMQSGELEKSLREDPELAERLRKAFGL